MNSNLKRRFLKISKWFALIFVLLFCFRILYGYIATDNNTGNDYSNDFFSSIDNLRKNYASEKIAMKGGDVQVSSNIASNQKFEKTASIISKTSEFAKDEKQIKGVVKSFNSIIQYEQNLGNEGSRQIHLLIGVNPNMFDNFYLAVKKIGVITATEITKVDKTNEYRQLNAKKTSIANTLQSLNDLKSKGGQISDFVTLNDKILETEEKFQELGVELGNFDAENEFCTVKLSLYEGATEQSISFIHRVKVALEWTIKYFALFVFGLFGLSLTVFILLLIIDKLKIMQNISGKFGE